jgi:trk system potassium uptake protein TrkH
MHITRPLGRLLTMFGLAYLPPLVAAGVCGDGGLASFGAGAGLVLMCGALLRLLARRQTRELKTRDAFLLMSLALILLSGFAAVPLLLAVPGLSFTDAYFEAASGLTTTGATVLDDIEHLPHALKLWRHELSWIGGIGILGMALAVLPLLGIGGMQLYRVQGSGPIKESRLTPRLRQTVGSLSAIYLGLTALCTLALRAAGMDWFDALCHAFSALSLSAFSTHDASIAWFDSPAVELVLMVFMLLAAMNFATHFLAWRGRTLKPYLSDPEAPAMLALVLGGSLALALYLQAQGIYPDFWHALRRAAFNLVALATTCGLHTADYDRWPLAAGLWLLLLSCLCASAGSTGGGIKMMRTLILFRQSARELDSLRHPTAVHALKVRGQAIEERALLSVFGFIHVYTISMLGLSFVLILSGMDFLTAFSAIVATLNNAGPGLRAVGPAQTYSSLNDFQTWVCTAAMMVGRLEILMLLVPLTPRFWKE